MFGKLLKSVSWQVRAELRRSLKSNQDYKKLRWNRVERILIACTTHYIRAMLVLWSAAFGAVCVVEYFRPVLQPFALQHFKGITTLSGWMSKEGANKQVMSSQADSLIKISRIWADFFPANTSNQPI
ncbi:MAG: hypothetical protein E6326_25175 [Enterobacter roggenkampii]|nr:hypothetical protein [Enterobacter roggenkampii]MDU2776659.1 hypothetical protein [Klebsiella grimontii]MDU7047199.1 hypothetical protein [Enterobacter roggenkampii]OUF08457.1 hypothetical protein AZZ95_000142 [Enterobacter roggenkampii]